MAKRLLKRLTVNMYMILYTAFLLLPFVANLQIKPLQSGLNTKHFGYLACLRYCFDTPTHVQTTDVLFRKHETIHHFST